MAAAPIQFNDYSADQADIDRRRSYALALQQQSQQPLETQMAGGWAIPISPTQGLAKALQAYSGRKGQEQASTEQRALGQKYQSDLASTLRNATQAGAGTPAQEPLTPNDDEGNAMPGVSAVAPDSARMAAILAGHPATQQSGINMMMADAQRKQMMQAFGLSGAPDAAAGAAPAPVVPGTPSQVSNAPAGTPAPSGGLPRNVEMGLLLADPSGKLLATKRAELAAEAQKPVNVRPGGAVWNPTQGVMFNQPQVGPGVNLSYGPGGPVAAPIPGAAPAMAAQAAAVAGGHAAGELPYKPPQVIQTEGAPTLATPAQQIEMATGAPPPPVPGALPNPTTVSRGTAPPSSAMQAAQLATTAARAQTDRPAILADEMAQEQENLQTATRRGDQNAVQTAQRNIRDLQGEINGGPRRPFRLQDQGANAEQIGRGKEASELAFTAPAARSAVADTTSNLDRMVKEARAVMDDPALSKITGLIGVVPNIPGSKASDVQARLNALKSQVGFAVLQSMRNASKTGGALGAISDKENDLLQRNLAALDNTQSPEAMKRALQQVIDYAAGARSRMERGYKDQYERVQGNQTMTPTPLGAQPVAPRVVDW